MQEIIIINGKSDINAWHLSKQENKPVLVCYHYSDLGMFIEPNGKIETNFPLSKIVLINYGEGFSGSQHTLTRNKIPQERCKGYVLQ